MKAQDLSIYTMRYLKKRPIKTMLMHLFFIFAVCLFYDTAFAQKNKERETEIISSTENTEKLSEFFIYPVKFYRKYMSGGDGDRCPMYPSCSRYCVETFKKHGALKGWIMTCDRLLRCGRDELRLSAPIFINGEIRCHDPVSNNDFWWK